MAATLSFCIPTYNRASELEQLLLSIEASIKVSGRPLSDFEICISDNASTDETPNVVQGWQNRLPEQIRYFRSDQNVGPDRNYLQAVSIASGEFCWLLGSDDAVSEDAVQQALPTLQGRDVILCNRQECDLQLKPTQRGSWLAPDVDEVTVDFSSDSDIVAYLSQARSIGAIFSFLSCIIVRRSLWNRAPDPDRFVGTAYPHVYIILAGLRSGGTLFFTKKDWILNRQGNDHFMKDGQAKRILIDLSAYPAIANAIFPSSPAVRTEILAVLRRERPFNHIKNLFRATEKQHWHPLTRTLEAAGYSRFAIFRAQLRGRLRSSV